MAATKEELYKEIEGLLSRKEQKDNQENKSPVELSISLRRLEVLEEQEFFEKKQDPNFNRLARVQGLLMLAAQNGNVLAISPLLDFCRRDPNYFIVLQDEYGIVKNTNTVIEVLTQNGRYGMSVLDMAVRQGQVEFVEKLIKILKQNNASMNFYPLIEKARENSKAGSHPFVPPRGKPKPDIVDELQLQIQVHALEGFLKDLEKKIGIKYHQYEEKCKEESLELGERYNILKEDFIDKILKELTLEEVEQLYMAQEYDTDKVRFARIVAAYGSEEQRASINNLNLILIGRIDSLYVFVNKEKSRAAQEVDLKTKQEEKLEEQELSDKEKEHDALPTLERLIYDFEYAFAEDNKGVRSVEVSKMVNRAYEKSSEFTTSEEYEKLHSKKGQFYLSGEEKFDKAKSTILGLCKKNKIHLKYLEEDFLTRHPEFKQNLQNETIIQALFQGAINSHDSKYYQALKNAFEKFVINFDQLNLPKMNVGKTAVSYNAHVVKFHRAPSLFKKEKEENKEKDSKKEGEQTTERSTPSDSSNKI